MKMRAKATTSKEVNHERSWCLVELDQIRKLLAEVSCPTCQELDSLTITKDYKKRHGFSELLKVACTLCDFETASAFSSPKSSISGAYEINVLMALLTQELGMVYSALSKFEKVLGLRSMHLKTYQHHAQCVADATEAMVETNLETAAKIVREAYQDLGDENVIDIAVSYDGTWHKRGFTSHYGVGAVVEVQTGLVVDYEVLSTYCHTCAISSPNNHNCKKKFAPARPWRQK
jgi:hypothetical protein